MEKSETYYLPVIAAQDFEAFRRLLKDEIGATYEIWLQRHREKVSYYGTANVVEINIAPDQFARFCHSETRAYDGKTLVDLAFRLGESNA